MKHRTPLKNKSGKTVRIKTGKGHGSKRQLPSMHVSKRQQRLMRQEFEMCFTEEKP